MIKKIRSFTRSANKSVLVRSLWQSLRRPDSTSASLETHLDASYQWLCAAQDASPDRGVAAWYHLIDGWSTSYPETTGYIIPTLLAYSRARNNQEARQRALEMAEWETSIQMPSGAVLSGLLGDKPGPAVFNTGQVLFGWIAAYKETGDTGFVHAIERAATWLLDVQDKDGAWRQQLSELTTSSVQTYNVRTAWGLALAGETLGQQIWVEAAQKNCDWALQQQNDAGWYANNGFSPDETPLLHTVSYAIEGLLGTGLVLGEERFVASAKSAIDALLKSFSQVGGLRGRYDSRWHPSVPWRCLPGEAQIATVLLRWCRIVADSDGYRRTAESIVGRLCGLQQTESSSGPVRGGLSGSSPVWGSYCRYSYLNWAAKFHLDSLLLLVDEIDPDFEAD